MLDIREEMEQLGDLGREALLPEDAIDEDELNEELNKLELECKIEEESPKPPTDDEAGGKKQATSPENGSEIVREAVASDRTETPEAEAKSVPA